MRAVRKAIRSKFMHLKTMATQYVEPWEITLDEFSEWCETNDILAKGREGKLTVVRRDKSEPWTIGNLALGKRELRDQRDMLKNLLTVSQWVECLKQDKMSIN